MLRPDRFMPVATGVDGIGSFENVIKDFQCLVLSNVCCAHVIFKVGYIGLADECK